jgi:hypothetical protein
MTWIAVGLGRIGSDGGYLYKRCRPISNPCLPRHTPMAGSVQVQVSGARDSTWLKLATQERRTHSKDQVRWGVAFWKAIAALKSIVDSPSERGWVRDYVAVKSDPVITNIIKHRISPFRTAGCFQIRNTRWFLALEHKLVDSNLFGSPSFSIYSNKF